jgi:hypothetical protein
MGRLHVGALCSSVVVLVGGGSVFGFSALQQVLLEEHVFSSLCEGALSPCDAEVERLTLLFSIAIGCLYVAVFPIGFVIDFLGASLVMAFGSLFAFSAFVVVAVFPGEALAWSLAIPLLGVCSPALFMSALILPRFLHPHSSRWTMLIISSFDVGSGVFLGLLLVPAMSRGVFLGVLGGVTLVCGAIAAWCLPSVREVSDLQESESHFEAAETLKQSLSSIDFWAATGFIAVWSMKNSFYLASFESIWRLFDNATSGTAVFVLNCAMPVAGLLALPLGVLLFRLRVDAVFAVVVGVGLAYSVCNFFLNNVAQYVGVVFYSFMRPLKWGVV